MPLRYACFISYRRYEDNELSDKFVNDLYKALKNELDLKVGAGRVFLDSKSRDMSPGAILPDKLSRQLCESACLVVIYNADYFSRDNMWCAREFKAMLDLEQARWQRLAPEEQANGHIVIIVLRDKESLPPPVIQNRLVCFFDSWTLFTRALPKNRQLYPDIQRMAGYIAGRFKALQALERPGALDPDPCCNICPTYSMPSEDAARRWLDNFGRSAGRVIPEEYADEFPR